MLKKVVSLVVLAFIIVAGSLPAKAADKEVVMYEDHGAIYSYNVATGKSTPIGESFNWDWNKKANEVAIVPGSQMVRVFDLVSGNSTDIALPSNITSWYVALSPDGKQVAYGSNDQTGTKIYLQDITATAPAKTLSCTCALYAIKWRNNSIYGLSITNSGHYLFSIDIDTGKAQPFDPVGKGQSIAGYAFGEADWAAILYTSKDPSESVFGDDLVVSSLSMQGVAFEIKETVRDGLDIFNDTLVFSTGYQIYAVDMGNPKHPLTKLTSLGINSEPLFSSNGNFVSFQTAREETKGDELPYLMGSDGSFQHRLDPNAQNR